MLQVKTYLLEAIICMSADIVKSLLLPEVSKVQAPPPKAIQDRTWTKSTETLITQSVHSMQ